jgi:hypothetical protein
MKRLHALASLLAMCAPTLAHHAPNSFVRLDFRAQSVGVRLMVPRSELAYAMEDTPTADSLPAYLLRHVGASTPQGAAWSVRVSAVRAITYLEQAYFEAELEFLPPPGRTPRDFIFTDDAVTHEVRNHVIFVVAARNSTDLALERAPELAGALQYPARQLAIRRPANAPARRQAHVPER